MKKELVKNFIICTAIAAVGIIMASIFFLAGYSASLKNDITSSLLTIAAHTLGLGCFITSLIGAFGAVNNLSKLKKRIK